ncbi:MAG: hypothetical protein LKJ87_02860 [Bacteroidales bacterium]|nr:hypothetical protein [Bacteroidales bacterium]
MNTPKIRFKGFDGSGKMICLHVGQYLIASGASALTSTPKATMRKNVNCFRLFYGNVRICVSCSNHIFAHKHLQGCRR